MCSLKIFRLFRSFAGDCIRIRSHSLCISLSLRNRCIRFRSVSCLTTFFRLYTIEILTTKKAKTTNGERELRLQQKQKLKFGLRKIPTQVPTANNID